MAWLSPSAPVPSAEAQAGGDDRRELLRIDDRLLLEYWRPGESRGRTLSQQEADEAIKCFIARPTTELLNRAAVQAPDGPAAAETLLVPWLMKIDWALDLILAALVRMHPEGLAMPLPVQVNISGGGICFEARERLEENEPLEMRLILPPFVPIRSALEVTRVEALSAQDGGGYVVAARFTSISTEDRERVIRHILRVQAERIRARHLNAGGAREGVL